MKIVQLIAWSVVGLLARRPSQVNTLCTNKIVRSGTLYTINDGGEEGVYKRLKHFIIRKEKRKDRQREKERERERRERREKKIACPALSESSIARWLLSVGLHVRLKA